MPATRRKRILYLALAALCLGTPEIVAQSSPADGAPSRFVQTQPAQSGSLAGRLTNLHSAPLAGVSIVLRNQSTGAEARTTTAKNGAFRFASLDAGDYTLEADAAQLGHGRLEGILVTGGAESRVQAALNFEPVAPLLLEASAPAQIAAPPKAAANLAYDSSASPAAAPSVAPRVPAQTPISTAETAAAVQPPVFPRPHLSISASQLIASVEN